MRKIFATMTAIAVVCTIVLSSGEFSRNCSESIREHFYGSVELAFLSVACFFLMAAYLTFKILEDLFD